MTTDLERFEAVARAGETTRVGARGVRRLAYLGAFVAFAAVGFVLSPSPVTPERALGFSALALSLGAAAAFVRAWLMRDVPVATFDPEGVRFRGPFVEQFLAWQDLEGAYVVPHQRRFHIALVPKDLAGVLAAASPWRRRWLLSNVGTIGAPFTLPISELAPRRLFAILKAYALVYGDIESRDARARAPGQGVGS